MKKHEMTIAHLKTYIEVLEDRWRKLCELNANDDDVARASKTGKASSVNEIVNELRARFGIERS